MRSRSLQSEPVIVSFSGIDGAGKSTQIANLQAHLQAQGRQVRTITFWEDVARLKQLREGAGQKVFKGEPGVGSPEAPVARMDKNVQSPLMTLIRLGLYLLDALSLRRTIKRARRVPADVIIFDRFLYDELANLDLRNPLARMYIRRVARLVPRPALSLFLDADPEKARARKPEYPLKFLHANRAAYLNLSQLLGGITVIPPLPLEAAEARVLQAFTAAVSESSR